MGDNFLDTANGFPVRLIVVDRVAGCTVEVQAVTVSTIIVQLMLLILQYTFPAPLR
jgi:hypothetical protein